MHFYVQVDRETSERAGAADMFQLVSIEDENGVERHGNFPV
jgi:hypothetical protein